MSLPRPEVSVDTSWQFPTPVIHTLDNGLRLWLFDLPSQYVVSGTLVLDAPLNKEPSGLDGVAAITVRSSDEGTRAHPGSAITEALEDEGIVFGGAVTRTATLIHFDLPSTRLQQALPLIDEIIETPDFAPKDIERQISHRLADIEYDQASPSSQVRYGFHQAIYDPTSRDGRPAGGLVETLTAISPQAVREYHEQWWQPEGATLVLAGALPGGILEQIDAAFGSWAPRLAGQRPLASRSAEAQLNQTGPHAWIIDHPDAQQTEIRLGGLAPGRHDPRWAALDVAATAIGGSFGSRLNRVLREQKGYTYGAHAGFHSRAGIGVFAAAASCRNDVAVAAVAEMLQILDLASEPLSPDEVNAAKNYLLGIAPLHFQTADAIADQASSLVFSGASANWINEHHQAVSLVDAAQADEAFRSAIDPARQNVVLCGPAKLLQPGLEALGLQPRIVELVH